jgi:hypothetical protein
MQRSIRSVELDGRAGVFQRFLDLVGLFLRDAFLDGLGGAVDQFLGFLEAEGRDLADRLDDLDLLVAGRFETTLNEVFSSSSAAPPPSLAATMTAPPAAGSMPYVSFM